MHHKLLFVVLAMALLAGCAELGIENPFEAEAPETFEFAPVSEAQPGSLHVSNQATIRGLTERARISLDKGELVLNGEKSNAAYVNNRDRVAVELHASSEYDTTVTANLSVGSLTVPFNITTKPAPTVLTVTSLANDGEGSLRNLVQNAEDDSIILFDESLAGSIELLQPIGIDTDLHIQGPGSDVVSLDGLGSSRLISIASETNARISGLELRNGYVAGDLENDGGAISVRSNATLVLEAVTIRDSFASDAGGAILNSGNLTLIDSQVVDNEARVGGGVYSTGTLTIQSSQFARNTSSSTCGGVCGSGGSITISDSSFTLNRADGSGGGVGAVGFGGSRIVVADSLFQDNATSSAGGGIYNSWGTTTVTNSVFRNNSADGAAGAIYSGSTLRVSESLLEGNTAQNGGALSIWQNTGARIDSSTFLQNEAAADGGVISSGLNLTVANSTMIGNHAGSNGGAINGSRITLEHTLISGNSAGGSGSGLHVRGLTTTGSVIAGNSGGDIAGLRSIVNSGGYNIVGIGDDTGLIHGANGDLVGTAANPLTMRINEPADNGGPTPTAMLDAGSPAIGAIPAEDCLLDVDQRGFERPGTDDHCDIGPVESR